MLEPRTAALTYNVVFTSALAWVCPDFQFTEATTIFSFCTHIPNFITSFLYPFFTHKVVKNVIIIFYYRIFLRWLYSNPGPGQYRAMECLTTSSKKYCIQSIIFICIHRKKVLMNSENDCLNPTPNYLLCHRTIFIQ